MFDIFLEAFKRFRGQGKRGSCWIKVLFTCFLQNREHHKYINDQFDDFK